MWLGEYSLGLRGARESAHEERDGEADDEHVNTELDQIRAERMTRSRGGEWHHNQIHEKPDADAKDEPGDNRTRVENRKPATGEVENRGRPKGDHEMESQSQRRRGWAAFERTPAQQSAGDKLQDASGRGTPRRRVDEC